MVAPTCHHGGAYPCHLCKEEDKIGGSIEKTIRRSSLWTCPSCSYTNAYPGHCENCGQVVQSRLLPRPGSGKQRGARSLWLKSNQEWQDEKLPRTKEGEIVRQKLRSKRFSLILPGLVILYDIVRKTDWSNLTSIVCAFFAAAFVLLMHWYVIYPVLMWVVTWIPNTHQLLAENKHLRDENQKLLQKVGQQSEYR